MPTNPQRPLAPHVRAAIAPTAQRKVPAAAAGSRPLAAHVQRAVVPPTRANPAVQASGIVRDGRGAGPKSILHGAPSASIPTPRRGHVVQSMELIPNEWDTSEEAPLLVRRVAPARLNVRKISFLDFFRGDKGFDVDVGKHHAADTGLVSTNGVAGCLGIVMHDPVRCRGAVGHAFDHAGNTEASLPAAKMLILSMICDLGGHQQALELLLFNGFGLDWGEERKTRLIETITSMSWKSVTDYSARTMKKQLVSSFVVYEPETGTCSISQ